MRTTRPFAGAATGLSKLSRVTPYPSSLPTGPRLIMAS